MIKNMVLGENVGRLGFGAMRLPIIDGDAAHVDQAAVDEMIDAAFAGGVNYFDTAYPYHEGMSEIALGKALSRYPRESFFLATKYPGHQISDQYDPKVVFEDQLEKCGVEHFDFYLLHNIYENSIDVYTDEKWGILDYFIEQKRNGRIHHLGFSAHGRPDLLKRFLDYGAEKYAALVRDDPDTANKFSGENVMEFCQIQLNYLDWTLQNAAEKCEILEDLEIPVVVMEPLRGGRLVTLEDNLKAELQSVNPDMEPIEWAFRWLQEIPNVKVILSGMSSLEQVRQNCELFEAERPLGYKETAVLMDIAELMKGGVPCTACRYCVDSCPQGIDIPMMMAAYNDVQFQPSVIVGMQLDAVPEGKRASDCIDCRACKRMCPQGIDIPEVLSELVVAIDKLPKWAESSRRREEAAKKIREERARQRGSVTASVKLEETEEDLSEGSAGELAGVGEAQ